MKIVGFYSEQSFYFLYFLTFIFSPPYNNAIIFDKHETVDTNHKFVGIITKKGEKSPIPGHNVTGETKILTYWVEQHNKVTTDNVTGISETGQAGYAKTEVPNTSDLYRSGYYTEGKEETKAPGIPFLPNANSNLKEFDENKSFSISRDYTDNAIYKQAPLASDFGSAVGQSAAYSYCLNSEDLNNYLRGIKNFEGEKLEHEKMTITELDKVFSCARTTAPMTVYRGVNSMPGGFEEWFAEGREHIEEGFMSTSSNPKNTLGHHLIAIEMPEGTSAISVWEDKHGDVFSVYGDTETEILLARNTKYKVVRWDITPDGEKIPVCRIIEDFSS